MIWQCNLLKYVHSTAGINICLFEYELRSETWYDRSKVLRTKINYVKKRFLFIVRISQNHLRLNRTFAFYKLWYFSWIEDRSKYFQYRRSRRLYKSLAMQQRASLYRSSSTQHWRSGYCIHTALTFRILHPHSTDVPELIIFFAPP